MHPYSINAGAITEVHSYQPTYITESASKLITEARRYIGTPYKHQGRNKYGLDCGGIIILTFKRFGVECIDIPVYNFACDVDITTNLEKSGFKKVNTPMPGDVLVFKVGGRLQHLGLMTDKGMIHCTDHVGKVVETVIGSWRSRLFCGYRMEV